VYGFEHIGLGLPDTCELPILENGCDCENGGPLLLLWSNLVSDREVEYVVGTTAVGLVIPGPV